MSISIMGQLSFPRHETFNSLCVILLTPQQEMCQTFCTPHYYYCFYDLRVSGEYTLYYADASYSHPQLADLDVLTYYASFTVSPALLTSSHNVSKTYFLEQEHLSPLLDLCLSSNETTYMVDDIVHYTLSLYNQSPFILRHLDVHVLLNSGLAFMTHSTCINHCAEPDASVISGLILLELSPYEQTTLSFDAQIINSSSLPSTAQVCYECIVPDTPKPFVHTSTCPPHYLSIYSPYLDITIHPSISCASLGDTISFEVLLTNSGDLDILNLSLSHTCNYCELLEDSLYINDSCIHGISLDTPLFIQYIGCKETVKVSFKVLVSGGISSSPTIDYCCTCHFMYHIPQHGLKECKDILASYHLPLNPCIFKQCLIENEFEFPEDTPSPTHISSVSLNITPLKHTLITTPTGSCSGGIISTGSQLIIHLLLEYTLTYYGDICHPTCLTTHYTIPFSTYLMLPPHTPSSYIPCVHYTLKDHFTQILSTRHFLIASYLLVICDSIT